MKTCGLKSITIGNKSVPAGSVVAALESASKVEGRAHQLAKSFSKLPEGVTYTEWENWWIKQIEKTDGRNVTERDLSKGQKYTAEEKSIAKELVAALKPKKGVSNETRRTLNAIRKALKDNPAGLNPQQLRKVFGDVASIITREADVKELNSLIKKAKTNIQKGKAGINIPFNAEKLLRVNPHSLTDAQFATFNRIMNVLGAKEAVLSIPSDLQQKISKFLTGLSEHNLNEIQEKQKQTKKERTLEYNKEVEAYKAQIRGSKIEFSLLNDKPSRDLINSLGDVSNLSDEDLNRLTLPELRNLSKSIENINNGYGVNNATFNIVTKLNSYKSQRLIVPVVDGANSHWLLGAYQRTMGKLLSIGKDKKNWILEVFRANPLSNIDSFIGSKGREIVEGIFTKVAQAFERFSLAQKALAQHAERAESLLSKKYLGNRKKIVKSKFKIYILQLVREYETNKGQDGIVNPYNEVINTIDGAKGSQTYYGTEEGAILKELVDDFAENERFDLNALQESLNDTELEVLQITDEMYKGANDVAAFTTQVVHGEKAPIYNNYVYKNRVNKDGAATNDINEEDFLAGKNSFRDQMISVRSGSTKARTGNEGSLKMDPIDNAYRSAKNILMDYHMSPTIKETRLTTNAIADKFTSEKTGSFSALAAEAIDAALEESLKNVFNAATQVPSVTDKLLSAAVTNGYRMVLASVPRAMAETATNITFVATTAPKEFSLGATKYFSESMDETSVDIFLNAGSTMGSKLFERGTLTGKFAESDILSAKVKTKDRIGSVGEQRIAQMFHLLTKNKGVALTRNLVTKLSDFLVSSPDKAIGRPLWFGVMDTQFKKLTGKDIDFQKIKEGDEAYLTKYKNEIAEARARADEYATFAGAATNPFQTVLKLQQTGGDKATKAGIFKVINSYMARFMFFEQATFMKGLNAAVGRSYLTPGQGVSLMSATMLRMGLYNATRIAIISSVATALGLKNEEDDEDEFQRNVLKDMIGSFTSLVVNRNLVTIPKLFTNYGIEQINKDYLDFLRDGEKYDPYKHSIVFSQLGERDFGYGKGSADFLAKLSGKYSPLFKSGDKAWKKAGEIFKAKGAKQDRLIEEFFTEISVEAAALTGMLPLYRDIMTYQKLKGKKK